MHVKNFLVTIWVINIGFNEEVLVEIFVDHDDYILGKEMITHQEHYDGTVLKTHISNHITSRKCTYRTTDLGKIPSIGFEGVLELWFQIGSVIELVMAAKSHVMLPISDRWHDGV